MEQSPGTTFRLYSYRIFEGLRECHGSYVVGCCLVRYSPSWRAYELVNLSHARIVMGTETRGRSFVGAVATLLRATIKTMLTEHDAFITD